REIIETIQRKNIALFHDKVYSPIDTKSIQKWKKDLSEREIMIADYVSGRTGSDSGYEKKYTSIPFRLKMLLIIRVRFIKTVLYFRHISKSLPGIMRKQFQKESMSLDNLYPLFFKS
ncbi:DUF1836 domain-containing protein, partial [Candidatus Venteria ishoeyi]|uniref:DUF1836 domain-containing protein n=1 Tax=Candidatus Venteria ishoeyi TaxID=1899563 RepID=UPI0015A832A7